RHPVQIAIGKPEELATLSQVSSGISLGFCYLTLKKGSRLNVHEKMEKRVEFDLEYIREWSIWFDIKIVFLTIFKGFVNKAAY
ncbi:sugar transferase, partial [Salmonella enterica subsp. enterica serovar Cerro]|nr:sugar transferase [Salmonella enterica subsp. enterica serovar Cerro]